MDSYSEQDGLPLNCCHAKGFVRYSGDLEAFWRRHMQLLTGIETFDLCGFSSVPGM